MAALLLERDAVGLDDGPEVMGFLDRLDLLFRYFHEKAPFPETLSSRKVRVPMTFFLLYFEVRLMVHLLYHVVKHYFAPERMEHKMMAI